MRRLHLLTSAGTLLAFIGEGVYMLVRFPAAYHGDPTMHMLFRSAHVYLLFSALLNATLGLYVRPSPARPRLQLAGSVLVLAAPALLLLAFLLEPAPARLSRPYAGAGAFAAFLGVVFHCVAARGRQSATGLEPPRPSPEPERQRDARATAAV